METFTCNNGETRELKGFVCFHNFKGWADPNAPDPTHNHTLVEPLKAAKVFGPGERMQALEFVKNNPEFVFTVRVGRKI